MEVTVHHQGGVQFEAIARGHRVISDQPADNGGSDTGMTPPELLLASLGTCAGFYAAQYLRNHSLPNAGLTVHVEAAKLKQPARMGQFRIEVLAADLSEAHQAGMLRAVKACLIHNTLMQPSAIETVVRSAATALV